MHRDVSQDLQEVGEVGSMRALTKGLPATGRLFRAGTFLAFLILCAALSLLSPYFFRVGNALNIARQSSVILVLALASMFVIISGGIDLSVGSNLALSSCVMGVLILRYGMHPWLAIFVGLLVATLVGAINGLAIAKGRVPPFIATLATMSAARGFALLVSGGFPAPDLPPPFEQIGMGEILGIPVAALLALLMALGAAFVLRMTRLGRYTFSMGSNAEAARLSGINVEYQTISIYMIAGALSGIAGVILTGRMNAAHPLMGGGMELQAIGSVVLGGTSLSGGEGGVGGTILGALIITVIGNGMNLLDVSSFWQDVIIGSVILAIVLADSWRKRTQE